MKNHSNNKFHKYVLLAGCILWASISCSDESNENFDKIDLQIGPEYVVEFSEFSVDGAEDVIIDHAKGTVTVVFPCGSDVSAVSPAIAVANGASVTPSSSTELNLNAPKDYTVVNGNIFKKYRVTADVRCVTGFLSHASTRAAITDDDEKAYADWFFTTYPSQVAEFVSFADIKSGAVDLSKYKTLTWYLDGTATEVFQMPSIAQDTDVLNAITNYYKAGGNLYLLGYAGRYLIDLGRLPDNKYFIEVGNGYGFENGDTWGIGTAVLGEDESDHEIFAGIPLTVNGARKTFPVIGKGWRENHNYVLIRIPEVYGMNNDNVAAYHKFNEENSTRWLGVWDGIGDFFMAGIIEFLPTDDYEGRIIFQGIGGIEWNQNKEGEINPEGVNEHRGNIEKLAKNSISYLTIY